MDIRIKTGLISMGFNVLLSILKVILFTITGSLSILAEAWHSISDILTSLLVVLALSSRKHRTRRESDNEAESEEERNRPEKRFELTAEQYVAMGIGVFLTIVALLLFRKVWTASPIPIDRPLISGISFLIFALGSYFIYRFEISIGQQVISIGLISDGYHSKADTIGALLTGGTMILYSFGINLDRLTAIVISFFVLSFGIEMITVTLLNRKVTDMNRFMKVKTYNILFYCMDKDNMKRVVQRIDHVMGWNLRNHLHRGRIFFRYFSWIILIVVLSGYFSTSLYTVTAKEQAVLLRFGRPCNPGRPVQPGLHVKIPWPIDTTIKFRQDVQKLDVGNVSDSEAFALLWTQEHGTEEPFLSGDNNFFYPYITIHYRIRDPFAYITENVQPVEFLDNAAHSVITRLFAEKNFDAVTVTDRDTIESFILSLTQLELDSGHTGLEIVSVNFRDIHPPILVADAYEGVIAARQEREQLINFGYGYRNSKVPEQRGEAARLIEGAHAYSLKRVQEARGNAERFERQMSGDRIQRNLTCHRLYLDTLASVLPKLDLTIVDSHAGSSSLLFDTLKVPALLNDTRKKESK